MDQLGLILLSTASTCVLLNGSLGFRICHARGLRQGDPLLSMMFLLVMEVLHALIRKSDQWSLFQGFGWIWILHRASLYADDLVMFITPSTADLNQTRCIFMTFEGASGLGCNLAKCQFGLIRCDEDQLIAATMILPCQVMEFPMKYLGIPLSTTKLLKCVWQLLLDKVADKLPLWKGQLLQCTGRLTLIRTTLSAIPMFTAISLELPHWVIKTLVKIMRAFLWCGTDEVQGGKCLVAWHQVQRPLCLGGLGIVDLKRFGMALRLRWLWLDRMEPDRPWTSLTAKEDP
jgi:hypothetical protein